MNIKTLLLGSVAAFAAVSGAQAADAPVTMVEPEPVEYVRVCDVYGTGFFYIPGTETCLKIGGYVRVRFQGNDRQYNNDIDSDGFGIEDGGVLVDRTGNGYNVGTRTRARLDFDAREETELGTLRGKIRLEATNAPANGNGSAEYTAEEAYIQLGGLTVGYLDSVWTADDGGISDGLLSDEADWATGDFQANRISYTAAFSGFSGTVSVEDDGSGDFIPDVIAKLSYKGGFGGAYVMGVYDEDALDFSLGDRFGVPANGLQLFGQGQGNSFGNYDLFGDSGRDEGAFVVKAGIQLENLVLADSIFKVEGHYAFDPSVYAIDDNVFGYSNGGSNNFGFTANPLTGNITNFGDSSLLLPSEWQVGAGYQQTFGKLFAVVSGVYGETFDLDSTFSGVNFTAAGAVPVGSEFGNNLGSPSYFGVAGNLGYQITSNFSTLAEVSYVEVDMKGGINDIEQTRGLLEFRRDF